MRRSWLNESNTGKPVAGIDGIQLLVVIKAIERGLSGDMLSVAEPYVLVHHRHLGRHCRIGHIVIRVTTLAHTWPTNRKHVLSPHAFPSAPSAFSLLNITNIVFTCKILSRTFRHIGWFPYTGEFSHTIYEGGWNWTLNTEHYGLTCLYQNTVQLEPHYSIVM